MGILKGSSRIAVCLCCATILLTGFSALAWSAESDYNGVYAGTYTGDDSGYWVAIADSNGTSAFVAWSTTYDRGDAGILDWWGESLGIGNYYTSDTEIQGSWVNTYIDSTDDSVDGEWGNPSSGDSGTLTGDIIDTSAYAGSYSGFFCGDDTGTWSLTISDDGSVTGTLVSDNYGPNNMIGVCHPAGYVLGIGESGGDYFGFFSQIVVSSISGEWLAQDGSTGSISASACSSSGGGGSGGGGGGGGCFILSLAGEFLTD